MKSVAVILIIFLFSSFSKTSDPAIENVRGVWKGYFGTENEINGMVIKIGQHNQAEIICNYSGGVLKSNGTYKLLNNTTIIISCLLAQSKSCEMVLYGYLNRSSSFMDGEWGESGKEKGCFYLQKQFEKPNL